MHYGKLDDIGLNFWRIELCLGRLKIGNKEFNKSIYETISQLCENLKNTYDKYKIDELLNRVDFVIDCFNNYNGNAYGHLENVLNLIDELIRGVIVKENSRK